MQYSTIMNFFCIDEQQSLCIIDLRHTVVFELDLYVMRQRCLSFSYTTTMLIVRLMFSLAWLARLFYLNIRHVVLVIVKLQCLLMMS
jgi:hypothetical protein